MHFCLAQIGNVIRNDSSMKGHISSNRRIRILYLAPYMAKFDVTQSFPLIMDVTLGTRPQDPSGMRLSLLTENKAGTREKTRGNVES